MYDALRKKRDLWDFFTKKEEYNPIFTDKHNRFPFYLSTNRVIFEPIVSEFLVENGLNPGYPGDKKFAVCLTHDIDIIYPEKRQQIIGTLKSLAKGNLADAIKTPFSRTIKKWNPYWNFKEIMELEAKYNAKSSFYFLISEKGNIDYNYDIIDLENELKYIIDNRWEVGLHGGYDAYYNLEKIKEQKRNLEKIICKEIIGYRNHVLRFKIPDTWQLLHEAGIMYDTTLGYADCAGFRNGICHPFNPINLDTNGKISILEIPLAIMDTTLFDYMKLDIETAWNLIKLLIDIVEKNYGIITILWHNTSFTGKYIELYENILKYCYEKNAWITSGSEIYDWVQNSNFLDKL